MFSEDADDTGRDQSGHLPVLLTECLACLARAPTGTFLDATFGGGGHTRALLERFPACHVLALDRDPAAEQRASAVAAAYPGRFTFQRMNFAKLADLPEIRFAGVLFDFGVSSYQLDQGHRGFSFRQDGPADMRMDPDHGHSAATFLETASREELINAIRNLGEEPHWRRVVDALIAARGTGQLQQTLTLAELIATAIPNRPGRARGRRHPATQSFQGIRMAINDELGAIETALPSAFDKLMPGGVLCTITFHSLEDRIVKRFTRRVCGRPEHRNDHRFADEREVLAEMLHRKAIEPDDAELATNPRSRSARLRAVQKATT